MTGVARWLAVASVLALVVAACGDNDGGGDDVPGGAGDVIEQENGSSGSDGSQDADDEPGSEDERVGGGGGPDLDPSSMPLAGEVVFEVDGQTFTIVSTEMDYFICELGDAFVNVRSESATQSLTVQLDTESGRGNANLTAEGSDARYDSFFGPETAGGATVEDPHLLYEGLFDASQIDDISDVSQVGQGRVSVTCP